MVGGDRAVGVDGDPYDRAGTTAYDHEIVEFDTLGRDILLDNAPKTVGCVAHRFDPSDFLNFCTTKEGGPRPTSTVHLSWLREYRCGLATAIWIDMAKPLRDRVFGVTSGSLPQFFAPKRPLLQVRLLPGGDQSCDEFLDATESRYRRLSRRPLGDLHLSVSEATRPDGQPERDSNEL